MFLSLVFTLWSFPIAFYAVWFKLQVSDTEEPRLFPAEGSVTVVAFCSWLPKLGVHQDPMGGCSSHLPFCCNLSPLRRASWRSHRLCLIVSEGYFWSCCCKWCLKQPRRGEDLHSVLSPGVLLHCSSQNELRPSLTVSGFFLIIFIAAILVQCFLTQLIEVHRTKVPMRQGRLRGSCLLDNQHRQSELLSTARWCGEMGKLQSFLCLLNKAVAQQLSQISGDGHWSCSHKHRVTFDRDCSPECENLGVPLPVPQALGLPLLYFSCTSEALTPQSLIKEIKRNFTRLNQKQIYRIKDCRIKNSGWKGETLKYSVYNKEI